MGYIVVKQDQGQVLYDGTVPPTTTHITWKSTIAGTHIRVFVFILLLGLLAFRSEAVTSVNLNVTGTDAQVWKNGTWKTSIKQMAGTTGGPPFVITSGGGFLTDQAGALDGSGNATMSLPANANIAPANSVWAFTVCPNASSPCLTQDVTVTVASPMTLNITPPPIVVNVLLVPPPVTAYTDGEISGAVQGTIYYNTTSLVYRQCNAAFGGVCTTWTGFGGTAVWSAITGIPPACTAGTFVTDIASGTCAPAFAPGSVLFSALGSGVNTIAHMTVGTGASLDTSGSGTIAATSAPFNGVSAGTNTNALLMGTGGTLGVTGTGTITATHAAAGTAGNCVQLGISRVFGDAGFPCGPGTVTNLTVGNLSPLFNSSVATSTTTPAITFSAISQSQRLFYASPSGSSGVPSFRAIVAADVPVINASSLPASTGNCTGGAGTYATGFNAGGSMICSTPTAAYTNWGSTTTVCSTTNAAGNTCTTSVPLNTTEVNTSYKIACSGTGAITGFPAILGVTKGTTSVTVTIINGEASMAQISSWFEIDCVITR